MEQVKLEKKDNKDVLQRKCVECNNVFVSQNIICPKCGSKKTTCAFK